MILWDRAGRIHEQLAVLWPNTTITEATANQQGLQSDQVQIVTGLGKSHTVLKNPVSITKANEQLAETLKIWNAELELRTYTRVGTRVIYRKIYPTEIEANEAVVGSGLVRFPELPIFNHKQASTSCNATLFWKDDSITTQVILKSEHKNLAIRDSDFPDLEKPHDLYYVTLDVDRGTRAPVDMEQFRLEDWLKGVQHVIARDIDKVLNGKS